MTGYVKISLFCGCNLLGVEFMGNEELTAMFAQKSTKEDLNFIARFFRRFIDAIKKVFGENKKYQQYVYDAEKLLGVFERAIKADGNKKSSGGVETRNAFAGKKANSADISLLEQARDMENNGRNADEILKETGWYKGADGEWRFEIDDSKMEVNTSGKFTRDPEKRRYIELFDKVFLGTDASEQEVSEFYELDKKLGKESFKPTKLGDLIKHPDLFKAYPELEDVNIAFVNTNENSDGAYDPILNGITLEKRNNIAPERLKSVLIHEIQHVIQKIENFARGASTEYWQAEIDAGREDGSRSAHDLYKNTAGEIEAREAENRKNLSAEERRERMPFVKNEKTVFTESLVKYYSANSNNDATIKEQIKQNSQMLNSMNPVIAIQNEGKQNRSKTAQLNAIMEDFTKKGFNVDREDFGIISFDKDLINESLNYLNTNAEFAAFYTLHKVLKQGVVLQESHNNHKSRGYDTVTIAAPVIINGVRGNVAIVVKKTKGNRHKTHRILMPDGSRFAFAEKGTAEATTGRMTANNSGESLPITSAVDNSISQKDGVVNTKSALSSKSAVTSATAGENSVFDDKQRKDVIRKLSAVAKMNGVTLSVASYCCFTYDFNA